MKLIKKLYCNINSLAISSMILLANVSPIIFSGVLQKHFSILVEIVFLLIYLLFIATNMLALAQMVFPWFPVRVFPEAEDKGFSVNSKLIENSCAVTLGVAFLECIILLILLK